MIPQFLLRRFAANRSVMKRFDVTLENLVGSRIHVKSATRERDLYVLDGLGKSYDYDERVVMGDLDDRAAKVLNRLWSADDLESVWPLSDHDRGALAQFLASLVLRTPRYRRHSQAIAEQSLADPDRLPLAIDLFRNGVITSESFPIKSVRRYFGVWMEGEEAPANFHAQVFRDHLNPLSKHLFEQRWILMRTPSPYFLLSDNPVALIDKTQAVEGFEYCSVNFLRSRAAFVALDRDLVLAIDWHPMETLRRTKDFGDQVVDFHENHARRSFGILLGNADRHVFSHPDDMHIERVIEECSAAEASGLKQER